MGTLPIITGIILSLTGLFYFGLIGFFTFGWYRPKGNFRSKALSSRMKISVIIAARNEAGNITELMGDLMVQDYPTALTEVIVVDDRSTDSTTKIVTDFISVNRLSGFILIKNSDSDGSGKKTALTYGVTKSTGDLIMTTDADCRVDPGWVSALAACFEDETKVMVFGPVCYFPRKGLLHRFQALEFSGLIASGAGAARAGHPFICNGASLAYRKSAFLRVKGFEGNERFISGDDVFLLHKMKKEFGDKAIGFSLEKKSLVQTYPAAGLLAFLRQRIRWASKSKGYNDPLAATTALIIFAFNFVLSVTFMAGFCYPVSFALFASFILLKSMIDLPLMWGITGFNHTRRLMFWYLPFQMIYPFYVVVAGVLSFFPRRKW